MTVLNGKSPSKFTSTAELAYMVEGSKQNPSEFSGSNFSKIEDFQSVHTRVDALRYAKIFHRRGLWVEVFCSSSKELIAGPFDPDQSMPNSL